MTDCCIIDMDVGGVAEFTIEVDSTEYAITADSTEFEIVAESSETAIEVAADEFEITASIEGPQGPPGESGVGSTEVLEAGETISALKPVVAIDGVAYIAVNTNTSHRGFVSGVSITAANSGSDITVQTLGQVQDNSWNWDTTKPWIFYANGTLTQTPPIAWCQPIARVVSSDTIFVRVLSGIER